MTEPHYDTLPHWLYQRFSEAADRAPWHKLSDDDRSYWEHQAAAVRRAAERDGFKHPEQTEARLRELADAKPTQVEPARDFAQLEIDLLVSAGARYLEALKEIAGSHDANSHALKRLARQAMSTPRARTRAGEIVSITGRMVAAVSPILTECCCGNPKIVGVVHRAKAPCYMQGSNNGINAELIPDEEDK